MATKINDTNQFFVFTWTVRSFRQFRENFPGAYSPSFTTLQNNSREGQINWRLLLLKENGYITVCLRRLEGGEKECYLKCEMSLVDSDGLCVISDCKNFPYDNKQNLVFNKFASMDRLLSDEKTRSVPDHSVDELTLRCTIWPTEAKPETTGLCFAITELANEVDCFFWTIEKFSSLERGEVRTFLRKPNLFSASPATLKLFLLEDRNIQINVTNQDPTDLFFTGWEVSVLNALGQTVERKEAQFCEEKRVKFLTSQILTSKTSDTEVNEKILSISLLTSKCKLTAQRDLLLPNDVLLLKFRWIKVYSSKILFDSRQTEKFCGSDSDIQKHITETLAQDMKNLFDDGSFSDFNFLVGSQKFPIHKAVLSTRSPVFKAMFTTDMKEKNQTSKELSDIDAKTLQQLLHYIYTDTVNELQFEDAAALYSAADKYELIPLKNVCSSLLKANICVSNVCKILVLSDMHSDDNLKRFAQDFIFDNGAEVLRSEAWKNIRKHHILLASETTEYMFLKRN